MGRHSRLCRDRLTEELRRMIISRITTVHDLTTQEGMARRRCTSGPSRTSTSMARHWTHVWLHTVRWTTHHLSKGTV